ncbi:MAG: hypothetical protein FWB74_02450 [Defluviitaleaceae bacterium]|nr:hypothetical protein [Defluviitaleaceae bacterium]
MRDDMALRENSVLVTYVAGGEGVGAGVTVAQGGAANFSRASQVVNGRGHSAGKMATLEPNVWRMDGSFMLPVQGGLANGVQVGYVSNGVSRTDGSFAVIPMFEVRFATVRNVPFISIVFDHNMGVAVSRAQFTFFNAAGTIIFEQFVDGDVSNGAPYSMGIAGVNGVSRILIRLHRTEKPFRRARVTQVHFAPVMVFDGESVISASVVHEGDVLGEGLPHNQLRVKLANDGRFNVLDGGGAISLLSQGCKLQYTIGVRHPNVPQGMRFTNYADYFLDKWSVSEKAVELTAYSRLRFLDGGVFMGSRFALEHMGDLARRIGADAGVEVVVPHVMNTYPRFPGFTGNVSHREALAMLAKLSSCLIYEDRAGRVHFVDLWSAHQPSLSHSIDFETSFSPPDITQGKYYNGVMLTEYMISLEHGLLASVGVDIAGSLEVLIPYKMPVWSDAQIAVSSGFSVTVIRRSTMFMEVRITGNGRCTAEVRGWRTALVSQPTFYPAPWKLGSEDEKPYEVNLPMFITNSVHIQSVREWFLARKFRLLERLVFCNAKWRQRASSELGENVMMQVDSRGREVRCRTVRQEIEFDRGVLKGVSKGVVL